MGKDLVLSVNLYVKLVIRHTSTDIQRLKTRLIDKCNGVFFLEKVIVFCAIARGKKTFSAVHHYLYVYCVTQGLQVGHTRGTSYPGSLVCRAAELL